MTIWISSVDNSKDRARIERDLTGPVTDEWVIINNRINRGDGTVGIAITGTGTATVEFTAQDFETIDTGTPASATWDQGTVSETTFGTFPTSVTGIRFIVTSGTIQGVISI